MLITMIGMVHGDREPELEPEPLDIAHKTLSVCVGITASVCVYLMCGCVGWGWCVWTLVSNGRQRQTCVSDR
jgi:hypothetical protein